ncbi:hypothetical protein BpHYR1_049164, partial [Brachionus plicatilis]
FDHKLQHALFLRYVFIKTAVVTKFGSCRLCDQVFSKNLIICLMSRIQYLGEIGRDFLDNFKF